MLDILDHLSDILIGVAILFLVPLIYIGLKQDALMRTVVSEQTEQFIDETRSQGYISRDMFEDFQQSLSKTGLLYDINLEHKQKILEPEYRFRTLEEVLEEQNKAFTGTNVYHYYPISTNIPVVTDPVDNSGLTMNTETNESVLANSSSTPSNGHVHTSTCYLDHTHTASCQIVGSNQTNKMVSASYSNDGTTIRCNVSLQCYGCHEPIYSINYYYNLWNSNVFQVGCAYKVENFDATGGLRTVSYNFSYSLTDPKINTIMSQINAIESVYAPYNGQTVVDLPSTNLLYIDAAQNLMYAPYTGCPTCGDITGPAVSVSVTNNSSSGMFGSYSSYQTLYHEGASHLIGELTYFQGAGDNIYHWMVDGISFYQKYLRKDGTISSKNGKSISRFLCEPGTGPRPGAEWTKIYTEYTINGTTYVADQWRKPNPEWGVALQKYYQSDYAWFGYDAKYSCPQCLKDGALPKSSEITYTCGLKETHRHSASCYYTLPVYYDTVNIERYDSGYNTYYQYYINIYSSDRKYFVQLIKSKDSYEGNGIYVYYANNGNTYYSSSMRQANPLCSAWDSMFSSVWNYLSGMFGPTPYYQWTTNWMYGGSLPALKFLTCYRNEYSAYGCNHIVASISPTHPVQSVYTNESLITTVTVTYQDGSTKVALANATYSTAAPGTKTVTLTYTDAMGTAKTCVISVTVIPRNKTCNNGHTYNLNNDGSDLGCIFCKAWLASLTIEFPITSTFTIYRGTTLSENGVILLATYLDGHTELIESEYLDNLDKYYVGSQYVTMSYKGHYAYLTVVTKRNLKLCPVCHRQYELHPDDADPGCPWCAANTPIFTGNVMQYYNKRYTHEILDELYEGDGIYRFSDEDFLSISVKSRKGSIGTNLLFTLYHNKNVSTVHVIEAGYIREDGYYYK